MALFNATMPSVRVPTSQSFKDLVRTQGPSSEVPPHKRPRLPNIAKDKHKQAMSAWCNTKITTILNVNDEMAKDRIRDMLRQWGCRWIVEEDMLLILCREEEECPICDRYERHVTLRVARDDGDEPTAEELALIRGTEDDDSMDTDIPVAEFESESDASESAVVFKSEEMTYLFRLRNLAARSQAFETVVKDERGMGQIEGMCGNMTAELQWAQLELIRVNGCWSATVVELETSQTAYTALETNHEELMAKHNVTVEENNALKKRLQLYEELAAKHEELVAKHEELAAKHDAVVDENNALKKQLELHQDETPRLSEENKALREQLEVALSGSAWQFPTNLSRGEWLAMKKPLPNVGPPQLLACWLQFQEHITIPGIPFGPDLMVDLRDIRGYKEVQSRVPAVAKSDRQTHDRCLLAILEILAVPGKYASLLHLHHIQVASQVKHLPLHVTSSSRVEDVAKLLGAQGLTEVVADDTWQYCRKVVRDMATTLGIHDKLVAQHLPTTPVPAEPLSLSYSWRRQAYRRAQFPLPTSARISLIVVVGLREAHNRRGSPARLRGNVATSSHRSNIARILLVVLLGLRNVKLTIAEGRRGSESVSLAAATSLSVGSVSAIYARISLIVVVGLREAHNRRGSPARLRGNAATSLSVGSVFAICARISLTLALGRRNVKLTTAEARLRA
ncbi:hypothetical protein DFH06DRAFT_1350071 [Mycena polygramma]|nr:hypothetical protein DFH06DRAFT_1350071 [Mycena polygramma]